LKISILTVAYNSAGTIADTLASVRAQDYPQVEHLVVDGASADGTMAVVSRFPHVAQAISEPDRGLYDAMNKGLRWATGDVVGILNSDDFYARPQVLSRVAALMEQTGADALYADLDYVDHRDTQRIVRQWKSGDYAEDRFLRGWMPPHPTFFARRSVYERLGGFDTRLRCSADYELMLRFLFKNQVSVCYLPEVIVRMRTGGMSNATLSHRLRANREDREAWRMNGLSPRFYTFLLKPLSKISQYRF
jgi:glycosyltransferase involved in cell wall biosynthesis